jgi:hypothetical protein
VGSAAGAGTGTATGAALATGTGSASGAGAASGVSLSGGTGTGTASGTSTASAVGQSLAIATGSASGVGSGNAVALVVVDNTRVTGGWVEDDDRRRARLRREREEREAEAQIREQLAKVYRKVKGLEPEIAEKIEAIEAKPVALIKPAEVRAISKATAIVDGGEMLALQRELRVLRQMVAAHQREMREWQDEEDILAILSMVA